MILLKIIYVKWKINVEVWGKGN